MNDEAKKSGTPNQIAIYQRIAAHADELVEGLLQLTKSRNENIALGAYKCLINKILPDLRSTELHGGVNADGTTEPIRLFINTGQGFIPATVSVSSTSTPSTTSESTTIQSTGMAPESTKDLHSDNGSTETITA